MSRLRPLWPYFALTLFAVLAAEPLARAEMTCSDDGPFHLFRAVELGALIEAGHFFPRWAPHMAQGYGYPFYNFYAPLSSYFVVLLHGLGLAYPAAMKLAFAASIWLAGMGAFLLVRDQWGARAGVVAGVAYLYAPYLAYDVLFRANLAESFAFVWPPLVLWALHRGLSAHPAPRITCHVSHFTFLAALFYAALILSHNLFALLASPLFGGYVLLRAWQQRALQTLWRGLASLLVGIALTAYFWLPALAERNLVHSDRLLVPPIFTWYTNFITPTELFAAPRAADPLLINPSPARGVGLIPALLCLPAVIAFLTGMGGKKTAKRETEKEREKGEGLQRAALSAAKPAAEPATIAFHALALAAYGFMTLPVSAPLWRAIPPLELVQFPWRMLGPAALCAAVLIGAGVSVLGGMFGGGVKPRIRGIVRIRPRSNLNPLNSVNPAFSIIVVLLLFAANLSWWYPRYCPSYGTATVADLVEYERATATVGTTAKGEYLPRTSAHVPADDSLARALMDNTEPSRLQLNVGEGEVSSPPPRDPLDATFDVAVRRETTAVYRQFYYPGWRVTVDGRPATIRVTPGAGLISFAIAPGPHTVHIYFGTTPLRAAAGAISLLTLAALVVALLSRPRASPSPDRPLTPPGIGPGELGLVVLLLALKLALLDRFPNPLRHSAFDHGADAIISVQVPLRADLSGGVNLYGYDLSSTALPADGALDAALYVSVREPADRRYWPAFTIEDDTGMAWHDLDYLPPRWHREPPHTPLWPVGQFAQWARHLTLLPGTPPGDYRLFAAIFDLDSLHIASLLDADGNAIAPRFPLGPVTVTRPRRAVTLRPENPTPRTFGPLALLGYHLSRGEAQAGETILLTLYWRSEGVTQTDYSARVDFSHVSAREAPPDGRLAFGVDAPPANAFPTSRWHPGDQWRGQHRVLLPAALADGEYQISLSVPGEPGAQALGKIKVAAPTRTFARPPSDFESGVSFEGVAVLEGYSLTRGEGAVVVTLVWRAAATPGLSYASFVHLSDEAGRVWLQSDAVPANWSRPTTGWVAGEYILDAHSLAGDLPPGEYRLWVGLYDPQTGRRVPAAGLGVSTDQRVEIGSVAVP